MARSTTIITSIGSDTSEAVTVDSTSWVTDSGTITLSASVPAAVVVGDVINDLGGNSYLITAIAGAVLTCNEFDTTVDPATGAATIGEAYSTITLWEADLDAGTNAEAYKSGDDAQGEVYNNAVFDETFTIDNGGTVGLNSILLTVPVSERHDGTDGSGARIVQSSGSGVTIQLKTPTTSNIVEWLEVTKTVTVTVGLLQFNPTVGGSVMGFRNMILHGVTNTGTAEGPACVNGSITTAIGQFLNNFCFNMEWSGNGTSEWELIEVNGTAGSSCMNNTLLDCNISHASSTANIQGIQVGDDLDNFVQNNIVCDISTSGSGTAVDYTTVSNPTESHNLSSDATASGTGSLIDKISANQFVSNTEPYDLHLKSGADAIDAGTDLGTTPSGIEIDIDGRDRDAEVDTWDMGADEFVAVAIDPFDDSILLNQTVLQASNF